MPSVFGISRVNVGGHKFQASITKTDWGGVACVWKNYTFMSMILISTQLQLLEMFCFVHIFFLYFPFAVMQVNTKNSLKASMDNHD